MRNYQEKKMSLFKLVKEIYHEKGIGGFYAGFPINLLRILPNTAIMFMAYESFSKIIARKLREFRERRIIAQKKI